MLEFSYHLLRDNIEQIEWDDFQRATRRKWEREQGRKDATDDMSEDLSEGEKEKSELIAEMGQSETPMKRFQRNISNLQVWNDDDKDKKLYMVLIRYLFSCYVFALAIETNMKSQL